MDIKKSKLLLLIAIGLQCVTTQAAKLEDCQTEECKGYFQQYMKKATTKATRASDRYKGYSQATAMVAEFYYHGYGVEKNKLEALKYFKLADKNGITSAKYKLGLIYLGDNELKDVKSAISYLKKAAHTNYLDANAILGRIYLTSEYGVKDIETADYYLSRAYDNKSSDMLTVLSYILNTYQDNFEDSFPTLSKAYNNYPLEIRDGAIVWPARNSNENIAKTDTTLASIFELQLASSVDATRGDLKYGFPSTRSDLGNNPFN